jgi:hypothetical protein
VPERGDVHGYLRFIANRRAVQVSPDPLFPNEENPFPWMSEMIDMKKERHFFETRVTKYQTGGAKVGTIFVNLIRCMQRSKIAAGFADMSVSAFA